MLVSNRPEVVGWVSQALDGPDAAIELHVLNHLEPSYIETVSPGCLILESAPDETSPLELLRHAQALTAAPAILLWPSCGPEQRLASMVAGAADALDAADWARRGLPYVVLRAVEMAGLSSQLTRHQREFRDFLDSSGDAVCAFSGSTIVYTNASFAEMCQRLGRLSVTDFAEVFGDPPSDPVQQRLQGMLAREPFDLPLGTGDARYIYSVRLRTVEFEGRSVWLATFRDVSKERRNEEMWLELQVSYQELKASQEQLFQAHKLQLLGELAAGVAHDFNNVLSAILGRAQLLKRYITQTEWKRSIDIIEQAALDGAETVRRIQGFSQVSNDRPSAPIDLNQVMRDALEFTRTRWFSNDGSKRGRFTIETAFSDVPPIDGHPSELREVMVNLIGNALDAMPSGGTLRLSTHASDLLAVAEVRDTGGGMSPDVKARALDPFFTTKGERGTGLGLSVSLAIITRHRGTLDIESQPGTGTLVAMRFPIVARRVLEAEPSRAEPTAPAPRGLRAHILVVDDDAHIRQLLQEVLSLEGHDVTVAANAESALAAARARTFDVAFIDLTVPGSSGFEIARALKAEHAASSIGIVTGYGATIDQALLTESGVDFVVAKPFKTEAILLHINARSSPLS
jgi:signal transduction histidine kinase